MVTKLIKSFVCVLFGCQTTDEDKKDNCVSDFSQYNPELMLML